MGAPLLSITMPTRNRVVGNGGARSNHRAERPLEQPCVEVTVSDGSDDDATGQVVGHGGLMANLVLQSFTYWSLR
jgi:hypothetical protein